MRFLLFTFLGLMALQMRSVAYGETLQLIYEHRPPYQINKGNGIVEGVLAGRVAKALDKANIEAKWIIHPSQRQMETIKKGNLHACALGWFKKPEREVFAKFSDVIYQDHPQIIIRRALDTHEIEHTTLEGFFGDPRYTLGVKSGYSYGAFVDDLLVKQTPVVMKTSTNIEGMIKMLLGKRFDYIISTPEEFMGLSSSLGAAMNGTVINELSDAPSGNKRYLMCSKKVSDDLISRFNEALALLH